VPLALLIIFKLLQTSRKILTIHALKTVLRGKFVQIGLMTYLYYNFD